MSEKAHIYLRVSSKGQVDGDGLERQSGECQLFAARKTWDARVWREEGVSGTLSGFERPVFSAMLADAIQNGVRHIVVERADRLARDLIESELILRECAAHYISVWCADSGENLSDVDADPTRKLIRQIMGALAEWDKSVLVKKMRAARERIRAEGRRCEGRKPYDDHDTIGLITDLRAEGRSLSQIADWLNEKCSDKSPTGKPWIKSTVKRILDREAA